MSTATHLTGVGAGPGNWRTMRLINGSAHVIPLGDGVVQTVVTSPPYWGLRRYAGEQETDWQDGTRHALGLEPTPELYVAHMVEVFREVKRVLRDDGTLWLNLGDSYAGSWGNQGRKPERGTQRPINGGMISPVNDDRYPSKGSNTGAVPAGLKPKDLVGIPWMVAFALRADGWYLRSDIIWHKPNPMPESVTDRPTKSHEYLFLLSKSERYFYDAEAIKEPAKWERWGDQTVIKEQQGTAKWIGNAATADIRRTTKNKRDVWTIPTRPYRGAHFAVFPPALVEPCVLAGSRPGDTVLDPFCGSGTVGMVSLQHGRRFVGVDISEEYLDMARARIGDIQHGLPGSAA